MKTLWNKATLLLVTFLFFFNPAFSNKIQVYICEAGQNFGQAVARAHIATEFGNSEMGEQESAMFENLENAVRFISLVEAELPEPWATIRKDNQHARRIQNMLDRLRSKWEELPLHQRVGEIESIYKSYLESLAYTYVTSRPDAIQKKPNCDSKIFQTCYQFGIAKIASETAGDPDRPLFVKQYHKNANARFSGTIASGLDLALDPGHKPFNGHSEKICCGFGLVESWQARPIFSENSQTSAYLDYEDEMKEIIRLADPGNICSNDVGHCISTDYYLSKSKWKGLDLSCFDDPRYSWLKVYLDDFVLTPELAPAWWRQQEKYETAVFTNWMLAYGAANHGATINMGWLEKEPTRKPADLFCPCNGKFSEVQKVQAGKITLPGLQTPTDFPGGVIYSYFSKQNTSVKFELKILNDQSTGTYIKNIAFYQDLANCILDQIESLGVTCDCSDPTQLRNIFESQNDPIVQGDGTEAPTNNPRPLLQDESSDVPLSILAKEKWLSGLKVQSLHFFEGPKEKPLLDQRKYKDHFSRDETQFIYWEMVVNAPNPDQKIDFEIESIWYNSDGKEHHRHTTKNYFLEEWTSRTYSGGYGNTDFFNWPSGNYSVEIFIDGKKVATNGFEVNSGPAVTTKDDWLASVQFKKINIFESDYGFEGNTFSKDNSFDASKTRYINFELGINSLPPMQDLNFTMDYRYLNGSGNIIYENSSQLTFPASKGLYYFKSGYGNKVPGKVFKPGEYHIEVFLEDRFMGKKSFSVY